MDKTACTIYLAADHAGFAHKAVVRDWLLSEQFRVIDCGADTFEATDDYPDFITKAAAAVSRQPQTNVAFLFGGSGQGEAMVANRFPNVRTTVYYGGNEEIIELSRSHNDANVVSFGARFIQVEDCQKVIWDWLHAAPELADRHVRRIKKVEHFRATAARGSYFL